MTKPIKMIEFGPGGPHVVEVSVPPVLAVEGTEPEGLSDLEIVGWILLGTLFTSGLLGLLIWWLVTW